MSVTIDSPTIDVTNPFCRLSVPCDIHDFWDATNHRYKSGYILTQVTAVTLTGTKTAGEMFNAEIKPPNLSQVCNSHALYNPLVTAADGWFTPTYTLVTAFNYGQQGPSARLEGDNSVSLVDFELQLSSITTSSIIAHLTYTTTITLKDPYADLGGTAYSRALQIYPDNDSAWGMVTLDAQSASAIGVQLKTLTSSVKQGIPLGSSPPMFTVANVPQTGGQQICNLAFPLGQSVSRVKTFDDFYTYIWSVNASRIDANATNVEFPHGDLTRFNLLNLGLTKDSGLSSDAASALLSYKAIVY